MEEDALISPTPGRRRTAGFAGLSQVPERSVLLSGWLGELCRVWAVGGRGLEREEEEGRGEKLQ